jgi:hypothetical protein
MIIELIGGEDDTEDDTEDELKTATIIRDCYNCLTPTFLRRLGL